MNIFIGSSPSDRAQFPVETFDDEGARRSHCSANADMDRLATGILTGSGPGASVRLSPPGHGYGRAGEDVDAVKQRAAAGRRTADRRVA
jgi:hypothetical protein